HPGVLARAVVVDLLRRPALLETELEVVFGRVRVREELPRGLDLLGCVVMGRARDRDLVVSEVVARAHERQRLQRLRSRAQEADELRIAGARDKFAAAHRDGVDTVPRLDNSVPAYLDEDRLIHDREPYADLRMVGISRMFRVCRPKTGTTTPRKTP